MKYSESLYNKILCSRAIQAHLQANTLINADWIQNIAVYISNNVHVHYIIIRLPYLLFRISIPKTWRLPPCSPYWMVTSIICGKIFVRWNKRLQKRKTTQKDYNQGKRPTLLNVTTHRTTQSCITLLNNSTVCSLAYCTLLIVYSCTVFDPCISNNLVSPCSCIPF